MSRYAASQATTANDIAVGDKFDDAVVIDVKHWPDGSVCLHLDDRMRHRHWHDGRTLTRVQKPLPPTPEERAIAKIKTLLNSGGMAPAISRILENEGL